MIKEVVLYPDPMLLSKCMDAPMDQSTRELCQHLEDTLYTTTGIGLAAPQIGYDQKVFLIDVQGYKDFCINPKIIAASNVLYKLDEGCLSLPGKTYNVERSAVISVEYYDKDFKLKREIFGNFKDIFSDFRGIVFQHEFDHLFGQLINHETRLNPLEIQR